MISQIYKPVSWMDVSASTGEAITENSNPNLDDWGWDNFWNSQDWIEWHKVMKEKKGKEFADTQFITWWKKQTLGASPLDKEEFNASLRIDSDFIKYVKSNNLFEKLNLIIGISKPTGAAIDAVDNVSDAVISASRIVKYAVPVVLIFALVLGSIYAYKKVQA